MSISPRQDARSFQVSQLEFEVPLSYIENCQSTVDDVRLYQLRNQSWVCLPTISRGSKNGFALYRGDSPEFSLYAIILLNRTEVPAGGDSIVATPTTTDNRRRIPKSCPSAYSRNDAGTSCTSRVGLWIFMDNFCYQYDYNNRNCNRCGPDKEVVDTLK